MKLAERLTRLSDQVLQIGKEIGRIPMSLDSWWSQYGGAKYWADGFTRKDFEKTILPKWQKHYTDTLKFVEGFEEKLEGLGLTPHDLKDEEHGHSAIKDVQAELSRFALLLKENEKLFHDFINPLTTKDQDVKKRFDKSTSVDDWEEFQKKYQEYKGGDLPVALKTELQKIEEAIDLDLAEIKTILKETGQNAKFQTALAHIERASQMLKNEYPRYHAILTELKAAESGFGVKGKEKPDTAKLDAEAKELHDAMEKLNLQHKSKSIDQKEYNVEVRHLKEQLGILLNKRSILLGEHIRYLENAIKHAESIIEKEQKHWDSLPKKSYKDRPRYIDFHSGLPREALEKYDDWWTELLTISNGIKGASSKLSKAADQIKKKQPTGPLDKKQLEKMKPKTQMQEALRDIAIKLLSGDKSDLDKWMETQVAKLQELIKPKSRLLSEQEVMGVVEMPVLIVKGFISQDSFTELRHHHFEFDRAVGNYQVIKNALLLGVSAKDVKDAGVEKLGTAYREIVSRATDDKLKAKLMKLHPVGPTLRKGGHIYAILIPNTIVDGFNVEKWGFYFGGANASALAKEQVYEPT